MAKESTNLGRTKVGEQIQLNPAVLSDIQAAVKAQQKANPTLTSEINQIASEAPTITDPTETYWSTEPVAGGGTGGGNNGLTPTGGQVYTATDGTKFTDAQAYATYQASLTGKATADLKASTEAKAAEEAKLADRQSAYDLLYNEFNKYGLGSLVDGIKGLIQSNVSPSQFAIELQNTDAYKKRFAANQQRIAAGLKALTPAEYIGLEDQYQNIMRNYGLPADYYSKDSMGTQAGFEKFIANDVSASELEDRVMTAQERLINASPEIMGQLKGYYNISNSDILAYVLDPQNALTKIKRRVQAAEIGAAAAGAGLQTGVARAEELAAAGITKAQAQQGYTDIAGILPRGSQLADIYGQQPYNQATAEAEVFNTAGAAEAAARRKKLTALETAQFSGSSGVGALGRDKALYGAMQGQQGLY